MMTWSWTCLVAMIFNGFGAISNELTGQGHAMAKASRRLPSVSLTQSTWTFHYTFI